MIRKETKVARFVAAVDAAVREHGFYSERAHEFVVEAIEDDSELALYLCRFTLVMATCPDTLWDSEIVRFVEALEESFDESELY